MKSRAKVNIGLQVLNQRPDGYHNLHTIFQELDFHDTVLISKTENGCVLKSNDKSFPLDKSNTCHKAYTILKREFPELSGVKIYMDKNIPACGGLGGGSSNGAAVLKGLNQMYMLGLSEDDLEQFAVEIGADVPFFIRGGCQLGEGIGERLTPIKVRLNGTFLLVIPPITISTNWAYKSLKKVLDTTREKANFADFFRRNIIPFELFQNDFERIVIPSHPEIGEIKGTLLMHGASFAGLSGSGSTVFGIFDEETAAEAAESVFPPNYRTTLTRPHLPTDGMLFN
ncbi:MAG: 4-(cytidine 5'-diphospho)-2-C-methyl-D-erythritol kinase [Fidelibacterota bacterium]